MTTKITKMDRASAKLVGEAISKALKGVADEYGLTYSPSGLRFDDSMVRGSFSFAAKGESGVPADFAKHCGRYGLTPADFGAEFTTGGRTFTITGVKPSRHKFPISGSDTDGKSYKFTAEQVVNGLKRTTPDDGLKIGDRVVFEGQFGERQEGTIQSFLGNNRAEVLTTTGDTRTPKRTELTITTRKRDEAEILSDITCVYGNLSPENLTCDGELGRTQIARRFRDYDKALKALFVELGREVSEHEADCQAKADY